MKLKSETTVTTRVAGTNYYTFNVPDVSERVILIHNPFNPQDENAIIVINQQLQQIGHITRLAGLNKKILNLMDGQPCFAKVVAVFPQFLEIFIEIDLTTFNQDSNSLNLLFRNISMN
jgi:hypothetical protein